MVYPQNYGSTYIGKYPCLKAGLEKTQELRKQAAEVALGYLGKNGGECSNLDILAFGSMARQEMHEKSDFDWLVIASSVVNEPEAIVHYKEAANAVQAELRLDPPGGFGIFGNAVGTAELVNTIGLDGDTNLTHTRRILVLQESWPLLDSKGHRNLLEAITRRYLYDRHAEKSAVPRFLINDIVRYWRTVAVDYQAKRWQEGGAKKQKWGLRLIKLRSSRKLAYAGTVISAFMPQIRGLTDEDAVASELVDQWQLPALVRLAQLDDYLAHECRGLLGTALEKADQLARYLRRADFRAQAETYEHPRLAPVETEVYTAYKLTADLDQALRELFLCRTPFKDSGESLFDLTTKYLLF